MALTLIKETGAGLANANSYAEVADGNAYHDGHLYATAWTAATDAQKAAALVMSSQHRAAHQRHQDDLGTATASRSSTTVTATIKRRFRR